MRIEIGRRAFRQVERASSRWQEHRPAAPFLFDDELEAALGLLLTAPNLGIPYPTAKRPNLRRLLLPSTDYHVYFALEDESLIVIHSVWGARRGRAPSL